MGLGLGLSLFGKRRREKGRVAAGNRRFLVCCVVQTKVNNQLKIKPTIHFCFALFFFALYFALYIASLWL